MQITVTNGTLTSVQETLSAPSGYKLPSSITVTGATHSYNASTGVLSLSNIENSVAIEGDAIPVIVYDLSQLSLSGGNHTVKVKARATNYRDSEFSNAETYTVPQLDAPVVEFYEDILTIEEVPNAEYYDIYVDGVLTDSYQQCEVAEIVIDSATVSGSSISIYDGDTKIYEWLASSGTNIEDYVSKTFNIKTNDVYVKASSSGIVHARYPSISGNGYPRTEKDSSNQEYIVNDIYGYEYLSVIIDLNY